MKYRFVSKIGDSIYFLRHLLIFRKLIKTRKNYFSSQRMQSRFKLEDAELLKKLFNHYGSDKSTHHDYHEVYARTIFNSGRYKIKKIFEIGIGSNDSSVPQNMGVTGVPGASLRAFRDWAPDAEVIGADIDPKTMFKETRIRTVVLDQLELISFKSLETKIGDGIDLVVIDGLHNPKADINSLIGLYPLVSAGGVIVIEDIAPKAANLLWRIAILTLRPFIILEIEKRQNGYILLVKKPESLQFTLGQ